LRKQHNLQKSDCLFVGDNLETDILLGKNAGIDTLLVMSGVTDEARLSGEKEIFPTYVSEHL
jgi:ribonucleotide monophosphatase NagD (HAD superfamily)